MTTCPKCGSRFLRPARARTFAEKMGRLRFIDPLRCLDCQTRFVARTVVLGHIFFAHCPNCRRMDLNGWTGKTYEPPFWMAVKIVFGGRRWRCEYCRLNFVSFRRRKEIFSFSRWKKLGFVAPNEVAGEDDEQTERTTEKGGTSRSARG